MPGHKSRCFVIAEAGVNHNGSLETAKQLVLEAKAAGADAVKFQTFQAELLVTPSAAKADYQRARTDAEQSQLEMLRQLELTYDDFACLYEFCQSQEIEFLSTPFDERSASFLNDLGMARFKIPSGEATNIRLIKHVAAFGKPIILSTGMCVIEDVRRAIQWITDVDPSPRVSVLQCVSSYPAKPEDTNLMAMATMRSEFGTPVGLSDHAVGYNIALGAVALGASILEKHFTLDRSMPGPDHLASLEPKELRSMIVAIREIESALGDGVKAPTPDELNVAKVARRSIVAARSLNKGTVLCESDLEFRRPGTGIEPRLFCQLISRTLVVDLPKDALIDWSMVE